MEASKSSRVLDKWKNGSVTSAWCEREREGSHRMAIALAEWDFKLDPVKETISPPPGLGVQKKANRPGQGPRGRSGALSGAF